MRATAAPVPTGRAHARPWPTLICVVGHPEGDATIHAGQSGTSGGCTARQGPPDASLRAPSRIGRRGPAAAIGPSPREGPHRTRDVARCRPPDPARHRLCGHDSPPGPPPCRGQPLDLLQGLERVGQRDSPDGAVPRLPTHRHHRLARRARQHREAPSRQGVGDCRGRARRHAHLRGRAPQARGAGRGRRGTCGHRPAIARPRDAPCDATSDATRDVARDAPCDATRDATRDAARDATRDATSDTACDATCDTTCDTPRHATRASTRNFTSGGAGAHGDGPIH